MISIASGVLLARPLITSEFVGLNVLNSQAVRWRKPIWLGTAKSKLYRVPKKPNIPPEEKAEIIRLHLNYHTYRTSIRRYLMRLAEASMVQFDPAVIREENEKDFARCSQLNDEWNREVAKSREAREKEALEARKKSVLEKLVQKEERDAELMEMVDNTVRKAKAERPTFITEKNIDQAIDEALSRIVNYNYAIDINGNKYDDSHPPTEPENKRERMQAEQ